MDYKKIHDSIITRAINRRLSKGFYKERHHIIPRCMGGGDEKSNLVHLTAKEHYIVHRLLMTIYPNNNKLKFAFWMMINANSSKKRYKVDSSRIYNEIREICASFVRERFENKSIESEMRRRAGISKNNKKSKSKEHTLNISLAKKGEKNPMRIHGIIGDKHHRSKSICQYDLNGNFMKKWGSINQARLNNEIINGRLYNIKNLSHKIIDGFIWSREERENILR